MTFLVALDPSMSWFYPFLAGLLLAPCGAVLGILAMYVVLAMFGVSEREGRRGLMAFLYGALPGLIAGFLVGSRLASWLAAGGGGSWRTALAGAVVAVPLAIVVGVCAWIAGMRWAESRGVPHEGGRRRTWSLYYVAMPAATLAAVAGYLLGAWLGTTA